MLVMRSPLCGAETRLGSGNRRRGPACRRSGGKRYRSRRGIGNAVCMMHIATGEEAEDIDPVKSAAELRSRGGMPGAKKLSAKDRTETARKAPAARRWGEQEGIPVLAVRQTGR